MCIYYKIWGGKKEKKMKHVKKRYKDTVGSTAVLPGVPDLSLGLTSMCRSCNPSHGCLTGKYCIIPVARVVRREGMSAPGLVLRPNLESGDE